MTFHYKGDPAGAGPQFGLIAEEVAEVNPDLVVRDRNGELLTVRYDAVNAMLLNEFLKEHRKVEEQGREMHKQKNTISQLKRTAATQEAIIGDLRSEIAQQRRETKAVVARLEEQESQLQRVSAQFAAASSSRGGLKLGKASLRAVLNDQ